MSRVLLPSSRFLAEKRSLPLSSRSLAMSSKPTLFPATSTESQTSLSSSPALSFQGEVSIPCPVACPDIPYPSPGNLLARAMSNLTRSTVRESGAVDEKPPSILMDCPLIVADRLSTFMSFPAISIVEGEMLQSSSLNQMLEGRVIPWISSFPSGPRSNSPDR